MASIYKRGPNWWVKYRVGGVLIRKSLKTKAQATAKKKLKSIQAQLDLGLLSAVGEAPLRDVVEQFLEHQVRLRRPRTVKAQRRHLEEFANHCPAKKIGGVEPRHVTAWLDSKDIAPPTRNQYRATLHRLFVWAMQEAGLVTQNPAAMTTRAKEVRRPHTYLTAIERDQVLERVAGTDLELPIAIGAFAGMRREEIALLEWKDVDLAAGFLTVRESKAKRPRDIPIHRRLRKLLEDAQRRSGLVCRRKGKAWDLDDLSREIRAAGRQLGKEKLSGPHVLRHTFGTLLAQAGAEAVEIRDLMGHSSLLVTQRYLGKSPRRRGTIDEI